MSHILIVDDEADIRQIIRILMEMKGHHCEEAENGLAALTRLYAEPFDLILTDQHMYGMTGIELLQTLQRKGKTPPPTILLSSDTNSMLRSMASQVGIRAVLTKPFETIELLRLVEETLCTHFPTPQPSLSQHILAF